MGKIFRNIDWIDFAVLTCMGAFGLFILASVDSSLFYQQAVFFIASFLVMVLVSSIDGMILIWFAPFAYVFSLVFLLLSYVGPSIRGASRWIVIGGVQIQPSEFVKPLILLCFSWFLTKYPPRTLKYTFLHFFLFLIPFFLVFKQPDLGTSIVYFSMWIGMMIAAGFPIKYLMTIAISFSALIPLLWKGLHDYQRSRIYTFLNPAIDPQGTGYNALQAMIAVGSGQLMGRGLGLGTQSHLRFLPEYHTDFIFATLVEELGLFGGLLLLGMYGLLLWRVIKPLFRREVTEAFPFIFSIGLFSMILTQVFINSGMNMGIIPVTGITLPLVSYGGSSLLSISIAYGFLWVIRRVSYTPT